MKLTFAYLMNLKVWIAACILQVSPFNDFISKYVFSDLGFLKWFAIAMILDLITGILKVIKLYGYKHVTSKGMRDTVSKVIQYGAFIIITHVLTNFEVNGVKAMTDFPWLNKLAYEFIMLIEIKSVYENIVAIDSRFDFMGKIISKIIDALPSKYKIDKDESKSK